MPALLLLISVGTFAGLFGLAKRVRVENRNRRVAIGLEWAEVQTLAGAGRASIAQTLARLKGEQVTALIVQEDTLSGLEAGGAARVERTTDVSGTTRTRVLLQNASDLPRIATALRLHGLANSVAPSPRSGGTVFTLDGLAATTETPDGAILASPADYGQLRGLGLGLSPEAVNTAKGAGLSLVARIGNFAGVSTASAHAVLSSLHLQGASLIIFSGDDVLGYRGLERNVALMLRDPAAAAAAQSTAAPEASGDAAPTGLTYGAVEFGKQRGDEAISLDLQGDYVRVHAIQSAELGTLSENEIEERFVKAARERNIRFCYVRLLTLAGDDPIGENVKFLQKIARGMERGSGWTGGGLEFGPARPLEETGIPHLFFGLISLGGAAGTVWMLLRFCPLPERWAWPLLVGLAIICGGLALTGESGRRLVALLTGIVYPALACLAALPQDSDVTRRVHGLASCVRQGIRRILFASAITLVGIVQVVGLLATRPFLVKANQFLGIKAQHAVPLLIVGLAVLLGGAGAQATWADWQARARRQFQSILDEPLRIGLTLISLIALIGLVIVVARTGNDAGVGVSGTELRFRAILDRLLPVRPRTKEVFVGHPAFVLAVAWWWRGRRKLALPLFVVGSLGQVSLLNTFCHIHTPLVISLWHAGLGLLLGIGLGVLLFVMLERLLPAPEADKPAGRRGSDENEAGRLAGSET